MKIIGLVGRSYTPDGRRATTGAGKDALARLLCALAAPAVTVAFADPVKRALIAACPWMSSSELWGDSDRRARVDHVTGRTPRELLRSLGTEWGRHMAGGVWDYGMRLTLQSLRAGLGYHPQMGAIRAGIGGPYQLVIVPDVRFESEVALLRSADAYIVRIDRPVQDLAESGHASEESVGWPDESFDYLVRNAHGLGELSVLAALLWCDLGHPGTRRAVQLSTPAEGAGL